MFNLGQVTSLLAKHSATIADNKPSKIIITPEVMKVQEKGQNLTTVLDAPPELNTARKVIEKIKGGQLINIRAETFQDGSFKYCLEFKDKKGKVKTYYGQYPESEKQEN